MMPHLIHKLFCVAVRVDVKYFSLPSQTLEFVYKALSHPVDLRKQIKVFTNAINENEAVINEMLVTWTIVLMINIHRFVEATALTKEN